MNKIKGILCVKSIRIWSYFGPHFPAFGLYTEKCGVSFRIQSECGKMNFEYELFSRNDINTSIKANIHNLT